MDFLIKIKKLCRICEEESNFIDLTHTNNQSYVKKFLSCANVTFDIDDQIPKNLCQICVTELEHSYSFKEKCERTQKKYEELLTPIETVLIQTTDIKVEYDDGDIDYNNYDSNHLLDKEDYEPTDEIKKAKLQIENLTYKIKTSKRNFICDICKKRFLTKKSIARHLSMLHNMARNLFECKYCGKYLMGTAYKTHISVHEKPFKCDLCSITFTSNQNLKRHISGVHDKLKNFKCDLCEAKYAQKSALDVHIESKHFNKYKFICDICGKRFKAKYCYTQHQLKHLSIEEQEKIKIKLFKCQLCDKSHKTEVDLKYHEMEQLCSENTKKDKTFICQYCGKVITNYHVYYVHIKRHSNDNPYKCDICKKGFKISTSLNLHKRIHFGEKPYKCDMCDMRFIRSHHLSSHKRTHTGEKPYKCEFCEKAFAHKMNCMTHRRLHTGEKPFHCEKCAESFIDLNGLKRHRIKHHPQ